MNDQLRRAQPKDPRVEAALSEYLELVDRGESIDPEHFLARHAAIANQLRSFIAAENEVRKLAGPEPVSDRSHISTSSLAAHGEETVVPQQGGKQRVEQDRPALTGQFGRYRIIRALGKGAMGTVYLAEDTQIGRLIALKTPHFTEDPTGEQKERFFREARAAGNLRHPNICPIHDFGQIDGKHFITMAYIEGRPLSALIQPERPQNERQILIVVRKLALALQEAHDHGIVHRDLKPSNIMVDKKDEPIIMDFGLAQQARRDEDARLTHTGIVLGTPAFMSPEQVEGDPAKIGPATDQYSLGVILYEMLTGQLPFGGSIVAVMRQIVTKAPTSPGQLRRNLDPRIEGVCLKMMAKIPAERFTSMTAVADELATILENPAAKPTSGEVGGLAGTGDTRTRAPWPERDQMQEDLGATRTLRPLTPMVVSENNPSATVESARHQRRRLPWSMVALGVAAVSMMAAVIVVYLGKTAVVIDIKEPGILVAVNGTILTVIGPNKQSVKVEPGEQTLKITYAGLESITKSFTLQRGDKKTVTVSLADAKLIAKLGNEILAERDVKSAPAGPAVKPPQSIAQSPRDQRKDTPPTTGSSDPDRTAAEWALSIGGAIQISLDRQGTGVPVIQLPRRSFTLTYVHLRDNRQVNDAGLSHFENCKNLTFLDLSANKVSDTGLVHCKDCKNLEVLYLESTLVTDAGLAFFKDCRNLKSLSLNNTKVSDAGLTNFKDSKRLTELDLSNTAIGDAGLACFKDCHNITRLLLDSTDLTDAGLVYFKDCKDLTVLYLFSTQVTDSGLDRFKDCKNLEAINLQNTKVTGASLAHLKGWPKMAKLCLVNQPVSDAELAPLKDCKNLTELGLIAEGISDAGLVYLKNSETLTALLLGTEKITDEGMAHLKTLTKIEKLVLYNTRVSDAGLEHLVSLTKLASLDLRGSKSVTAEGVKKLAAALPKCKIDWDGGVVGPKPNVTTTGGK
jgi:serine/threonine protein kinase/Leucine-rich repeat (LRR) protein